MSFNVARGANHCISALWTDALPTVCSCCGTTTTMYGHVFYHSQIPPFHKAAVSSVCLESNLFHVIKWRSLTGHAILAVLQFSVNAMAIMVVVSLSHRNLKRQGAPSALGPWQQCLATVGTNVLHTCWEKSYTEFVTGRNMYTEGCFPRLEPVNLDYPFTSGYLLHLWTLLHIHFSLIRKPVNLDEVAMHVIFLIIWVWV